jgi:sigma-B regulation protein RsbU (phosphoserine phosphatase)
MLAKIGYLSKNLEFKSKLLEKASRRSFGFRVIENNQLDQAQFVIVDAAKFVETYDKLTNATEKYWFVVSSKDNEWNVMNAIARKGAIHVIGANGEDFEKELQFCFDFYGAKIWPDFYAKENRGFPKRKIFLDKSSDINKCIEELVAGEDYSGYFEGPDKYLSIMANELLTNAFFNAPVNRSIDDSRRAQVTLDDEEMTEISLEKRDDKILLWVKDSFGRLTREQLVKSIVRGFREKTYEQKGGGAGLGLYLVYNYSNQLIVSLKPGISTEICCIIDSNRRLKKYKERVTSFHCFEEAAS